MKLRSLLSSLALLGSSGCAALPADNSNAYPSLARRPIERGEGAATPAPVPSAPAPVADTALDARLAELLAQGAAGATAFDQADATAERAVRSASGAAVSSEAWVNAQIAVSALETTRNDSVSALASIDSLYAERADAVSQGKAVGGLERIEAARSQVLTIVDSQNDRLDRLKAMLRQP